MQLAGNLLHTKYHYSRIPTKSEKTGAYISYNFECHYPEQEKSSYINCNIVPNISGQGQVPHALKFPIFLYLPDRMPRQKCTDKLPKPRIRFCWIYGITDSTEFTRARVEESLLFSHLVASIKESTSLSLNERRTRAPIKGKTPSAKRFNEIPFILT